MNGSIKKGFQLVAVLCFWPACAFGMGEMANYLYPGYGSGLFYILITFFGSLFGLTHAFYLLYCKR